MPSALLIVYYGAGWVVRDFHYCQHPSLEEEWVTLHPEIQMGVKRPGAMTSVDRRCVVMGCISPMDTTKYWQIRGNLLCLFCYFTLEQKLH